VHGVTGQGVWVWITIVSEGWCGHDGRVGEVEFETVGCGCGRGVTPVAAGAATAVPGFGLFFFWLPDSDNFYFFDD
jgi:hypothetical protein